MLPDPARRPGRPPGLRLAAGAAVLAMLTACGPGGAIDIGAAQPGGGTAQHGGAAQPGVGAASPLPVLGSNRAAPESAAPGEGLPSGGAPTPAGEPAAKPFAVPTADPTPSPLPPTDPYALNLYRQGDFVAQYTFEWCVGASIQMTLNMVTPRDDRTRALQHQLWEQARDLSDSPFGGANPIGWTAALNGLGVGSYALVSEPDLPAALRTAAAALRQTRRPVGLVMWSGRHAWVMSGFTSLGDPAAAANFQVTGVRVLDPLHPHGDDRWGTSPQPNSLLTPDQLGTQFVPRLGGRVDLGVAPGYLLVLPTPAG